MTAEVKVQEETQTAAEVLAEEPQKVAAKEAEKVAEGDVVVDEAKPKAVEKSSSYKEESNFLSDLKEFERKALNELKAKLEEAILGNNVFDEKKEEPKQKKEAEEKKEEAKEEVKKEGAEGVEPVKEEEEKKTEEGVVEEKSVEVEKYVSLWGVPLLPSKGDEGTDVVLLKFLRAREFKVNEAFEMLKKTLKWRKESKIDTLVDEDFGPELGSAAYMNGVDHEGHPVCYNIYGVFDSEELYQKSFGTEEKRSEFLRWRCQLMEKGIQKLSFKPGGVNSLLQINDLKNSPGPSKKELRVATKQVVSLLQDNYPEMVAKHVSCFYILLPFLFFEVLI